MSRVWYGVGAAAIVVAILWVVVTGVGWSNRMAALEVKAAKFDTVCGLVKSALHTDRNLLTFDVPTRDRMIANFGGDRIGDGFEMLDWCVPHVREFVAELRRCSGLRDYECVGRVLDAMELSIQ